MATSGPGATNLVTPIADAYMDSVPIVAITGQVNSAAIGTDAFQEADIRGITMPITKHNYLVTNPDEIPRAIAEAFHIAGTGRPGPVLVDISKDALTGSTTFSWPPVIDLPGYRPVARPHGKQIREAARYIAAARQPLFYIGGGVIRARASEVLRTLVDLTQIPVVTTLMARGAVPDSHPLHLGMPGMHGSVAAVTALQKTDLIIALGTRFDDRVTGQLSTFAPNAKVIHADIDPAEISKNRTADVPIVGDCKDVITDLIEAITAEQAAHGAAEYEAWQATVAEWKETYPVGYTTTPDGLSPQYVIERLGALSGPEATYVAGVGQHQMWAAQFVQYSRPNVDQLRGPGHHGLRRSGSHGRQGRRADRTVWAIDGDGCFQMTNQELATCVINDIPIKVAVINNSAWAWSGSGRRSSTTSATPTPTCTRATTSSASRTSSSSATPTAARAGGSSGPKRSTRRSSRPWRSTTARRHRLRRPPGRHGVADGAGRREQRQDPHRPRGSPPVGARSLSRPQTAPTSLPSRSSTERRRNA
jgi:acetolactate synthase-1/2/3 large subunit